VEDLLLALRDQLRSYTSVASTFDAQTLARSETEARQELSAAKERLAVLEGLLGEGGSTELKDLVERLKKDEKRIEVLEVEKRAMDLVSFVSPLSFDAIIIRAEAYASVYRLQICYIRKSIDSRPLGQLLTNNIIIKCSI
jgi:hypothetical protein